MLRLIFDLVCDFVAAACGALTDTVSPARLVAAPSRALSSFDRPVNHSLGTAEIDGCTVPVVVREADTLTHALFLGRTGRGKSKAGEVFLRDYIDRGRGFALVDPKERLVNDTLAYIAYRSKATGCDALLKRVILIDLTPESVPLLRAMYWEGDPSLPPSCEHTAREAWAAKEADVLIELIHRMMDEAEEGHPRTKRLLRDIFCALGSIGIEFGEAFVLLDPFHKRHHRVWDACKKAGVLPAEVVADLNMVHSLKRSQDKLAQIEGALNRLRALLSPLVRACFTDRLKGIDFARAIRERQIILVNASESRYISRFQARTIAGMVIHRLIEAVANEDPREQDARAPYGLFIDEAAEFMGPDIDRILRTGRTMKLPTFLFAQNVDAFERADVDYRETVLNETGLTFLFQSKTADEQVENILLHGGLLDFTRATREVDRPDGYDFVALPSVSSSSSRKLSFSVGGSRSRSEELTEAYGSSEAIEHALAAGGSQSSAQESSLQNTAGEASELRSTRTESQRRDWSHETSTSHSESSAQSRTVGRERSVSKAAGRRRSLQHTNGNTYSIGSSTEETADVTSRSAGNAHQFERSQSKRATDQTSRSMVNSSSTSHEDSIQTTQETSLSRSTSHTTGTQETTGSARRVGVARESGEQSSRANTNSQSTSHGHAQRTGRELSYQQRRAQTLTRNRSLAAMRGGSVSENFSLGTGVGFTEGQGLSVSALSRHRTEIEELPQLATDIDVQRHMLLTELSMLNVAECFFRNDGQGYTAKVRVREVVSPFASNTDYYDAIDDLKAKLRSIHGFLTVPDLTAEAEERRVSQLVERLSTPSPPEPQRLEHAGEPATEPESDPQQELDDDDDEVFG